ncbi:hypothetical protein EDB89DRAFT_2240005 [Lactarius sanguifluus]|nr:hypothetical protein EDB89DRAFT_2240005 [Lactarius sanguifluus]
MRNIRGRGSVNGRSELDIFKGRWAVRRRRGVEGQRQHEARPRGDARLAYGGWGASCQGVDGGPWRRRGEGEGDGERGERREGVEIDGEDQVTPDRARAIFTARDAPGADALKVEWVEAGDTRLPMLSVDMLGLLS